MDFNEEKLERVGKIVREMRYNGAVVHFDGENPDTAAVDVLGHNARRFVNVEYVDEAISALSMRAMLGDTSKADALLYEILICAGILPDPDKGKE